MPDVSNISLQEIRRRLVNTRGRRLWRSLDELSRSPAFLRALEEELPAAAGAGLNRRDFVLLFAATLAGASCARAPYEEIVPMLDQPDGRVPGISTEYASAEPWRGFARGVVVRSFEGRPIKVEGNALHPASLGATGPEAQAAVMTLWDPSRATPPLRLRGRGTWELFDRDLGSRLAATRAGEGVRVLTPATTSPALFRQIERLLRRYPDARWHQWDPLHGDTPARAGATIAFGRDVTPTYHLDRANVLVALDSDLLTGDPAALAYARAFADRRVPGRMNRFYAAEPMPTATGSAADRRLPCTASRVERLAFALASRLGVAPVSAELTAAETRWVDDAARDLAAHPGRALVVAGDPQPPHVHALAYAINTALGAIGTTLTLHAPVGSLPVDPHASIRELVTDMRLGNVTMLLIAGGNPVYDAPADFDFAGALGLVPWSAHLSLYEDETSTRTTWHLPQTHWLEQWADLRAFDGTATIAQPLIAPLYGGRSTYELLARAAGTPASGHDIIRSHWLEEGMADEAWRTALRDGVVPGTQAPAEAVALDTALIRSLRPIAPESPLELVFRPDPTIGDGEHVNNGWLQELPKPISMLVWDNAAMLAPSDAERAGIDNGDVVELQSERRLVRAAAWIVPGHAPGAVTLHLGYGHPHSGGVGTELGFNAYLLRTSREPSFTPVEMLKTGATYTLATTQLHGTMAGRDLVRVIDVNDGAVAIERVVPPSIYPDYQYDGHAWGMAIDLSRCIGCNACVVACYSENNIPFVGKEEVARGRDMQWLRVDRYFSGELDDPNIHHQPVLCMHCEKAPCEYVCPVAATVHSSEGLNEMVYNRCVGTRYCSNNCPYKVRRFNFFDYAPDDPAGRLRANPDVTIRSRGVMEKCTYCVQRISRARIEASKQQRPIRDGEVVTACQSACPSRAIVFGDINDPSAAVTELKNDPRNYGLLEELGTRPRTTYLAKVVNGQERPPDDGDDRGDG